MKFLLLMLIFSSLLFIACESEAEGIRRCDTIKCYVWEACNDDTGACDLKPGFCNENNQCTEGDLTICDTITHTCKKEELVNNCNLKCEVWQTCNEDTNICDLKTGFCNENSHCTENDLTVCDISNHTCKKDDVIDSCDPACETWETCNEDTTTCILKAGFCNEDSQCTEGDLTICDTNNHTCKEELVNDCNSSCQNWEECNETTNNCDLKPGFCNEDSQCTEGSLTVCNRVNHTCEMQGAYVLPLEIPVPSIDFTQDMPERPSDWSNEVPGYYYIDIVNGSTSAAYGTPTAPRKKIPTTLTESSYIEIEGDYDHGLYNNNSLIVTWNGTDDSNFVATESGPIWLTRSKEPGKTGAFTKVRLLLKGSNIFVSDINFKEYAKPQIGSATNGYPASNVVIRNIDVAGGISVNGDNIDSGSDNIIIYNSKFHDCGDVNAEHDEDAHVVTINPFSSNVWLINNVMHTASGAGLQIHGGSGNSHNTHNIYVANNHVYNVRQSGLWVKSGKDIIIANNHVHDIITTPWSVSKGIGAQYEPDGLWILNNHIHGMVYGVRVPSTTGTEWRQKIYVIGNVIHDINALGAEVGPIETPISSWQPAAIHLHGAHDHYIYNNLIFDAPNGIDLSGASTSRIRNNIILDVTESQADGENGYHILAEIQRLNEKVFIDNNYFGSDMNVQVISHSVYNTPESLNAIDGASGNIAGTNFITNENIDQLMSNMDISGIDFTQLKNMGADVDDILIQEFTSAFTSTLGIKSDIFGEMRKQGNSIDIGPFEIQ